MTAPNTYSGVDLKSLVHWFGGIEETFDPGTQVLWECLFCLYSLAGAGLVWYSLTGIDGAEAVFAVGVLIAGGSIATLIWMRRWLCTYRVLICREGMIEVYRGRHRAALWNEIARIDLNKPEPHLLGDRMLYSKRKQQSYLFRAVVWTEVVVLFKSGERLRLGCLNSEDVKHFTELIADRVARPQVD